jgi:hypothetical protein
MKESFAIKESYVQTAIIEYLAAEHILAFRMNTGAMKLDKRFVRFGVPGMADILAFPIKNYPDGNHGTWKLPQPLWIECKSTDGVQSTLQKSFQAMVEWHGHKYVIGRSTEDIKGFLGASRT